MKKSSNPLANVKSNAPLTVNIPSAGSGVTPNTHSRSGFTTGTAPVGIAGMGTKGFTKGLPTKKAR